MRTYFVDWFGPFEDAELGTKTLRKLMDWKELAKNGLYIITGKCARQRKVRVQYIGISKTTFSQRFANHSQKDQVEREFGVWIGKLDLQDEALRSELELVEHVLLYFSDDTPLNDRKKGTKPTHSCTVISRFWDKNWELHEDLGPHFNAVPDVLVWDKDTGVLHYSTRLEIWEP